MFSIQCIGKYSILIMLRIKVFSRIFQKYHSELIYSKLQKIILMRHTSLALLKHIHILVPHYPTLEKSRKEIICIINPYFTLSKCKIPVFPGPIYSLSETAAQECDRYENLISYGNLFQKF